MLLSWHWGEAKNRTLSNNFIGQGWDPPLCTEDSQEQEEQNYLAHDKQVLVSLTVLLLV